MMFLKETVGFILCRLGFHRWKTYIANVDSDVCQITLIWLECKRCAASKVKGVLHNGDFE